MDFSKNLVFGKFASVGKISLSSSFFSLKVSRSNISKSLIKSKFRCFIQIGQNGHFPLNLLYDLIVQQLRLSFIFFFCMRTAGELLLLPLFIFKEIHPWAMQLHLLPAHVSLSHRYNFGKFSPILTLSIFFSWLFEIFRVTLFSSFVFLCVLGEVWKPFGVWVSLVELLLLQFLQIPFLLPKASGYPLCN